MMKSLGVLGAALLLAGCAKPAAVPAATATRAPASAATAAMVRKALAGTGVQVVGRLSAPQGYRGFVGRYHGAPVPVYATPDGQHVLVGSLFDLHGHDLTGTAMDQLARTNFGEAQWHQLEAAHWIREGDATAPRVIYTFVDTRCPWCQRFWQASQPWIRAHKVQVRNVLVGVIKPDSLPEAAHILAAPDPLAAWVRNEANFARNLTPTTGASPVAIAQVRANTALMTQLGFTGTPGIIWKDRSGAVHTLQGMPKDAVALRAIFEN
ncbi:MAG TPA: thiol:disulfide interchange protein DsbG [Nevskiaceae bacterium]|nr:thiol:disulfide interchange protein DsbG [Nevskiaceae bacterium]